MDIVEQYYIKKFDSYYNGYNLDFGGTNRVRWTDEMKIHMSQLKSNLSDEEIERIREAHKNECIPIYQINFNGDIVNLWEYGAREASKKLGITQSCIWNCVNKKRKTYKGFIWIRVDEYNKETFNADNYITHKAKPNSYNMYDLDDNFIKHFNSYQDLIINGFDPSSVLKCAKGILNTYKGYKFEIIR